MNCRKFVTIWLQNRKNLKIFAVNIEAYVVKSAKFGGVERKRRRNPKAVRLWALFWA